MSETISSHESETGTINSMTSTSTNYHQSEAKNINSFDDASAPSSKPLDKTAYDVYINCHGFDVKHTVPIAICEVLCGMELKVFRVSEELRSGKVLPVAVLQETMRTASVCIAIFSPKYAQSSWCLSELSFMLKSGTPIIPVFYHIQPADLRWVGDGKGICKDAVLEHERKCRYSPEKLQEWKTALWNVSLYWGEIINNDYDERMMLKTIANHVFEVMQIVPLEVAKHPVDLQEAVADFEKIICPTPLEKLRIKKLPYDVFINHRGPDSRPTLVGSIYNVLGGMGLSVFLDSEELQFGDILPEVILQAMPVFRFSLPAM